MPINYFNKWGATKVKIEDIILYAYKNLSKKCDDYIKEHDYHSKYIADMFRYLADTIITSYPEVKDNSSIL